MTSIVERRPVSFAVGTLVFVIGITVLSRFVLETLFPSLTLAGIGLVTNWIYVAFSIALVAWLGWWKEIRLVSRLNRRALVYLLPLVAYVLVHPLLAGVAVPEVSLMEGQVLPDWATVIVIVLGVSLGAGIAEELLYRGVLLRALESRGRLFAAVLTAALFGLTHFSRVVLGDATVSEWLLGALLMLPIGIGLAAVAFRLDSLWPLIVWHMASDVSSHLAASESMAYVLSLLGVIVLIGAMGLWLLWQDRQSSKVSGQHKTGVIPTE